MRIWVRIVPASPSPLLGYLAFRRHVETTCQMSKQVRFASWRKDTLLQELSIGDLGETIAVITGGQVPQ